MKRMAGLILALGLFFAVEPVYAQILTEDNGRCAMGLITSHIGHEWGHKLSGIKNDGRAWDPNFLSLWGNQWNESQNNYRAIAMSGFAGQHVFSSVHASRPEDPYNLCVVYGDVFVSLFYAARAKYNLDSPGDYDPFTIARRREITTINIGISFLFAGMAWRIREDNEWITSRSPLFDFNAEFYGK